MKIYIYLIVMMFGTVLLGQQNSVDPKERDSMVVLRFSGGFHQENSFEAGSNQYTLEMSAYQQQYGKWWNGFTMALGSMGLDFDSTKAYTEQSLCCG